MDLDTGEHQVLREKYTGLVSGGRDGTIWLEKHTGLVSGEKDRTIGILGLDTGEHQVLKRYHFG